MQKEIIEDQYGIFEIIKPNGFAAKASVSVIMSVFNGETLLAKSTDSILGQSFEDFEFIIVNDGSTDKTLETICQYQNDSDKILVIDQENIGLTKSLNRAISLARGKYIARQDADDISLPERFKKQCKFLENNHGYFLVGCRHNVVGESDEVPCEPEMPVPIEDCSIKSTINKYNPFIHSFVMFRNDLSKLGYFYDTDYKYSQDYELWTRVRKYYKMHNLAETLGLSRQWPGMISEENMKSQRRYVLKFKKNLILHSFFDLGFWHYLLKDISVVYLPRSCRRLYRKILGKNK